MGFTRERVHTAVRFPAQPAAAFTLSKSVVVRGVTSTSIVSCHSLCSRQHWPDPPAHVGDFSVSMYLAYQVLVRSRANVAATQSACRYQKSAPRLQVRAAGAALLRNDYSVLLLAVATPIQRTRRKVTSLCGAASILQRSSDQFFVG
jgi:hypothetical protein